MAHHPDLLFGVPPACARVCVSMALHPLTHSLLPAAAVCGRPTSDHAAGDSCVLCGGIISVLHTPVAVSREKSCEEYTSSLAVLQDGRGWDFHVSCYLGPFHTTDPTLTSHPKALHRLDRVTPRNQAELQEASVQG
jgi:hypothetical protein